MFFVQRFMLLTDPIFFKYAVPDSIMDGYHLGGLGSNLVIVATLL